MSAFLLAELKSRVEMDTVEGRSKLVHEARPLLQKIAAPAMQLQLVKQVAESAGITQDEAVRLCGIQLSAPPKAVPASQSLPAFRSNERPSEYQPEQRPALSRNARQDKSMLLLERKPVRKLLQCLIAKPVLAEDLPLDFLDETLPEAAALVALATFLRETHEASASLVIGHFQGQAHEVPIRDAVLELEATRFDASHLEAEFRSILVGIEADRVKARIAELGRKMESDPGLSAEEKSEYSRLFHELSALRRQPAVEDPPVV